MSAKTAKARAAVHVNRNLFDNQ